MSINRNLRKFFLQELCVILIKRKYFDWKSAKIFPFHKGYFALKFYKKKNYYNIASKIKSI